MQVERHEFDQGIGALERAIDHGSAPPHHPPLLIGLEQDHYLGLAPLNSEFLPLRLAADADRLHSGSHTDPTAVHPDRNPLARELAAGWEFATTEEHQVAGAGGQHLCTQFVGDPPYRLLIQFQAATSQLGASLFDR